MMAKKNESTSIAYDRYNECVQCITDRTYNIPVKFKIFSDNLNCVVIDVIVSNSYIVSNFFLLITNPNNYIFARCDAKNIEKMYLYLF